MRRVLLLAVALLLAGPAAAFPCERVPRPALWDGAGPPDAGQADMTLAAHRGAANLAPENTLDAYAYAIAYGMDWIEVDVQQTLDRRFVAFHDTEVDAKTDGSGRIGLMTFEQVRALNAADNDKWRGGAYDPARIPSLEEVLALARDTGAGVYFDMKESVTDVPGLVALAHAYGVVERSAFLPYEPGRAALIAASDPRAPVMFSNPDPRLPAAALYALGAQYRWFGSDLPSYSAGKVSAIHDACARVIPNVYQGRVTGSEAGDLLHARALGADGAQINNPDVVADALDEPVATRIVAAAETACLVDARHGIGLPGKPVAVGDERATTDRDGCVRRRGGQPVDFAGDGSALPSGLRAGRS